MESVPDGVIVRLVKMQGAVPKRAMINLANCIELLLRFDNAKPYYSQIWQNAVSEIEKYQSLFLHFVDVLPVNVVEFVAILMKAAAQSDVAVEILAKITKHHPDANQYILLFLPTNNHNFPLLAELYGRLLDCPEILQLPEFYSVCSHLLTPERSFALSGLLKSDMVNRSLLEESGFLDHVVELLTTQPEPAWILDFICRLEAKYDFQKLRSIVSVLFEFLANFEIQDQAFLCLSEIGKYSMDGFDMDALMEFARTFQGTEVGPVAAAAAFLVAKFDAGSVEGLGDTAQAGLVDG
jgi:hypothetical protein